MEPRTWCMLGQWSKNWAPFTAQGRNFDLSFGYVKDCEEAQRLIHATDVGFFWFVFLFFFSFFLEVDTLNLNLISFGRPLCRQEPWKQSGYIQEDCGSHTCNCISLILSGRQVSNSSMKIIGEGHLSLRSHFGIFLGQNKVWLQVNVIHLYLFCSLQSTLPDCFQRIDFWNVWSHSNLKWLRGDISEHRHTYIHVDD